MHIYILSSVYILSILNKSKNSYFYVIYSINDKYNANLLSSDNVQPTYLNRSLMKLAANYFILSLIVVSSNSTESNTYKWDFILDTINN